MSGSTDRDCTSIDRDMDPQNFNSIQQPVKRFGF